MVTHNDELIGELSSEIPTVSQAQESLRLLRNLMLCVNKLEQALFAPGKRTRQTQLITSPFFVTQ